MSPRLVRRALLAVPLAAALLLAAGAGAVSGDRASGASARAFAIRIVTPTGGGGTDTYAAPGDQVAFGGTFAYPADGSIVSASSTAVSVSTDTATIATANASATITSLSLFNGEIVASSLVGKVHSAASPDSADGDADGTGIVGLNVVPGPLGDWGSLATSVASGAPTATEPPGYHGFVAALEVRLTADHGGLPAGSTIQVGYAEVTTQASASAPLPTAPASTPATTTAKQKGGKAPEPQSNGIPGPVRQPPSIVPKLTAGGYVFPVYGQSAFTDTFGAFRGDVSGGWHHGDDIFAALGAPLLAVAEGTVFSVGWNDVGGNRLWLRDSQGNEFYYAHLSAFSPLAVNGAHVQAGDVLGFLGNTGDAQGTPYHVHFEVHPVGLLGLGYDGAVNPTSYLLAWERLQDIRFDAASAWAPVPHTSVNAPKPGAILLQIQDISTASGLDPGSLDRAMAPVSREGDGALLRPGAGGTVGTGAQG
jgi:murein DD-endopeptidase MepM/ murein hydrolase activator NlpD